MGEYVVFSFVKDEMISREVLAEKLYDYFYHLELKEKLSFDDIFRKYVSDWNEIIKRYIPKEPQAKKGELPQPIQRSRKYYIYAMDIKSSRNLTIKHALDYSRIMICLYCAVIKKGHKTINDFDYSMKSWNIDKLIAAMKIEKARVHIGKKRQMFDISELYCTDTASFILTMIFFCFIKNDEVEGDY